jgi:hypothetical protein
MTDPKMFSGLQARAAFLGVVLVALRNDAERWAYFLTVGAVTSEVPSLEYVERWLDRLQAGAEATSET